MEIVCCIILYHCMFHSSVMDTQYTIILIIHHTVCDLYKGIYRAGYVLFVYDASVPWIGSFNK